MSKLNMDVLNREAVMAAAEESMFGLGNAGFCTACGEERDGCEPDASGYECYECGEMKVEGAAELMVAMG